MHSFHGFLWAIFLSPLWFVLLALPANDHVYAYLSDFDICILMIILAGNSLEVFSCASISKFDPPVFIRGDIQLLIFLFFCSHLIMCIYIIFYVVRNDILTNMFTQVAALTFGDFYNAQYVKMYNVFMVQLQVNSEIHFW